MKGAGGFLWALMWNACVYYDFCFFPVENITVLQKHFRL